MLSHAIEDEQVQILQRIKSGWEVPNWLDNATKAPNTSFATFTTGFISLITQPSLSLPTAFALDHTRIHHLQTRFQLLTFQAACRLTLSSTLHLLGWTGSTPKSSTHDIATLISAIEQDHSLDPTEQREALILGIANYAYRLCAKQGLPSAEVLRQTRNTLHIAIQDPPSLVSKRIATSLSAQLTKAVEKELEIVNGLDALQLSNRYTSMPAAGAGSNVLAPSPPNEAQQASVEEMARKIAHIAVLHWRVWAPILYLRIHNDDDGC